MIQTRSFLIPFLTLFGITFATEFPLSEWGLATYEGAKANIRKGTIFILDGGTDYWHVQLTRRNVVLQNGKTYEAKFSLRSEDQNRRIEVRIGRDGFPYDAFAEFGEIVATTTDKIFTKTFTMQAGDVGNARFEFNLGKRTGTIQILKASLNCLDCDDDLAYSEQVNSSKSQEYVAIADTINFRDNSMILGNIFGNSFELGADSKIYGDAEVSNECLLRERASITGMLRHSKPCLEQNGVAIGSKTEKISLKPKVKQPRILFGLEPVSVSAGKPIHLQPGSYGTFYANAGSQIKLSSGSYAFQNFYTEPDVEFFLDLPSRGISIGVLGDIRFGDRNKFSISGGNPSEILWNTTGKNVKFGTDGLYFGRFLAPTASIHLPPRSHLVGSVYAKKLIVEPQSTISTEPLADEISHSEEHFGPFFKPRVFRYRSAQPPSMNSIKMFFRATNDLSISVNGDTSKTVSLPSTNTTVKVSLARPTIPGFPIEAFRSKYIFTFAKDANYRIFWNPQTPCKEGCDGSAPETAIKDFSRVLAIAETFGREIHMSGGTWNICESFSEETVPWMVGFKLVGFEDDIRDLDSKDELPKIDLCNKAHIEIKGKSPRSLIGFQIKGGANKGNGGAIHSKSQRTTLKNIWISESKSARNGGAIFAAESLTIEDARFESNSAIGNGGSIWAGGNTKVFNAIFLGTNAVENGGAITLSSEDAYIGNSIFYNNHSGKFGGAIHNIGATLNLWNSTLFANTGFKGYGAIGGTAKGAIGNSIFWKNFSTECPQGKCKAEVVDGYSATNSSFSSTYQGAAIYIGDPKFIDERNPAGENMFMDYGTGINLSENSPLLEWGIVNKSVPEKDLIGSSRSQERTPLGAYGWTLSAEDTFVGILNKDGSVKATFPTIPVINDLPGSWLKSFLANSEFSRVLKASVKKHKKTKISSATIKVSVKNKEGKIYTDIPSVKFKVYRNGEEHGKYIFQSKTLTQGKPIIFSANSADVGVYDDVIVLSVKEDSDHLYIEVQ